MNVFASPPASAAGEHPAEIHDAQRLAALRRTGLLDSPADEEFDRVTRLAAKLLGTPIALISLVDADRQFFKSAHGLPEPWASRRQTPLSHSFCKHVVRTGEPLLVENSRVHPLVRCNGATTEIGVVAYAGIPLTSADGEMLGSFCVIDTVPRKWTEEEVVLLGDLAELVAGRIHPGAAAAQQLRSDTERVLEHVADAVIELDAGWRFRYLNGNAAHLLGCCGREVAGQVIWEACPALVATAVQVEARRASARQLTLSFEWFHTTLEAWYDVRVYPTPKGVTLHFCEVTERKRAEAAIHVRDRAIAAASVGIVIADARAADFPLIHVNPAFERITGYGAQEVIGRNCRFLQSPDTDPEAVAAVRDAVRREVPCDVTLLNRRKDGTPFWNRLIIAPVTDAAGELTHYIGVQHDVTEERRAVEALRESEAQLRQNHKMEAVGRMAGGVAHDFNNLLTAITGNASLILGDLPAGDPMREEMEEIWHAGTRAAALTRQFLAFTRQQVGRPQVLALNGQVEEMAKMFGRIVGEDVTLSLELDPSDPQVSADPAQLGQVLANLTINAREAMPEGGSLRVATRVALFSEEEAGRVGVAGAGRYVVLSVSDTGCGMDEVVRERAFEPFFTTKPPGHAIGLGLSTVYGIVRQSGGHTAIVSAPGRGTTIEIMLPEAVEADELPELSRAAPGAAPSVARVLVVEDEGAIRSLVCKVLQREGYTLMEAADGEEALRMVEECGDTIDLMITDVVMPRMGAGQLVREVAARWPKIRVIGMSGYMPDVVANHGIVEMSDAFLEKPFTPDALLRTVDRVITRAA